MNYEITFEENASADDLQVIDERHHRDRFDLPGLNAAVIQIAADPKCGH